MKLLLLTLEFPPQTGGIATYLATLCANAPEKADVAVIASRLANNMTFDVNAGYPIHRRSLETKWLFPRWLKSFFSALPFIVKFRPKYLAVSHLLPMGYVALMLRIYTGTPYIVFTHGTDILHARVNGWKRRMMRMLLHKASLVIANSVYTKELLAEEGIDHAEVITPCTPACSFSSDRERTNTDQIPVLLSVGRLVPRKGFDTMIAALAAVRREIPNVRYVIIGDGPDRDRLEKLAREQGVNDIVEFAGRVEDLGPHLRKASVYVHPARSTQFDVEGFGIAIIEASAAGLPVIVGASGGAIETVIDGKTGVLVDSADPAAFAVQVVALLNDPKRAREMGEAGRRWVSDKFSCKLVADRFWQLLNA
jgi:phosphatidylinositol alpha-1,6-mannosyltransferase